MLGILAKSLSGNKWTKISGNMTKQARQKFKTSPTVRLRESDFLSNPYNQPGGPCMHCCCMQTPKKRKQRLLRGARGGGGGELEMEAQPAGSLSQLMTSSQEGGGDDYAAEDLAPPSNNIQKCPSAPNIHHMTTVLHILRYLKVGTFLVIGLGSFLQMPSRRPMPTKGPPCQLGHGLPAMGPGRADSA